MDNMELLQRRLGMTHSLQRVSSKAKDLIRLCNLRFEAGLGDGEICKSMVCLELACISLQKPFERAKAIRYSGANEKVYCGTLFKIQNVLGIRPSLDARELCAKFGVSIRMVEAVQRTLSDYRARFIAGLPEVRKLSADFSRPVFLGSAFFLAARKRKLKVDKTKLIQACGSSEAEFANVTTSMYDLCFDSLGVEKRKRAAQDIRSNRDLLDGLPEKRARLASDLDDDDVINAGDSVTALPGTSKAKVAEEKREEYEEWKRKALASKANVKPKTHASTRKITLQNGSKQAKLSFVRLAQ